MLPRKIPESVSDVNFSSWVMPAILYVGTTPPNTLGKWRGFTDNLEICSSVIGISDAPNSTVPAVSWAMPPPEPMDW